MIHFSITMAEPLSMSKTSKANDIKCDIHDVVEILKSNNALDAICKPFINNTSTIGNSYDDTKNESKTSMPSLITRADQDIPRRDRTYLTIMPSESEESEDKTAGEIALNVFCILVCITASSMAAAFTIGVITINPFDLLVQVRTASTEKERQRAAALIPIVERRHQLMVTLLIINALANEALPIFIEEIVPGYMAVGLSVLSVLIFGDILPTALFSGPHKIKLSSFFVPLMNFLMCLLTPIALPISLFLDWILGHHDKSYDRNQFSALVRINYEERRRMLEDEDTEADISTDEDEKKISLLRTKSNRRQIGMDEVLLMEGALSLRSKRVNDIMKPIDQVFVLPDDTILSKEMIMKIFVSGHSRIPVFTRKRTSNFGISDDKLIKGVLLSKQLMLVESQDKKLLSTIPLQQPICVSPDMHLVELLQDFQQKRVSFKGGHLAIVCRDPFLATNAMDGGSPIPKNAGVLGIVTLEDVMEALLQTQIIDESDRLHQGVAHSNLFSLISSSTSCLP